ncbi:helix-turn-helix transcriptional regulator [Clostridium sp. D2Q-11]|uniref:Helix-turn-helix transcriptional regulator n=1 Tax=Anaeromonas frigoriresistens TaxID=2683708 RepID=A0A942UVC1_9FIRM|nr:helix-turn-helix domain-containing protein [Anaeromonas frigoriresistens]MBS4537484.1 helix-turn-helix transcriptional regulator [Anaeromonas frigoriresistens]
MKNNIDINNKKIGQRIRDERKQLNISRENFAELINLSGYYIGQLERGERQMSLPTMISIAKHLHVSLDYLIFGNEIQNSESINEIYGFYGEDETKYKEILKLLKKCSSHELEMFKKLLITILPYLQ